MPLIKYHLYAHHKELNQDVCIIKTSKRKDLKKFFVLFISNYNNFYDPHYCLYYPYETPENRILQHKEQMDNDVKDFKCQYNLIDFNINNYDINSFYFYDSVSKEVYDAVISDNHFNYWLLRVDNPLGEFSIIEKIKYNPYNRNYEKYLFCPNPNCSWNENEYFYLSLINNKIYKDFIKDMQAYYTDENIDLPDFISDMKITDIKECPVCRTPFNGKVQIKKEF